VTAALRFSPPVDADRLPARPSMNLVSKQHALLPYLASEHSGLEANVLRFDNPLQAARRCSTFPTLSKIPGGPKVCDANGQSLAYVYSRENPNDALMAKVHAEEHSEQHREAA
jgi:hypothetical protein